jgi:hypothetical protein
MVQILALVMEKAPLKESWGEIVGRIMGFLTIFKNLKGVVKMVEHLTVSRTMPQFLLLWTPPSISISYLHPNYMAIPESPFLYTGIGLG